MVLSHGSDGRMELRGHASDLDEMAAWPEVITLTRAEAGVYVGSVALPKREEVSHGGTGSTGERGEGEGKKEERTDEGTEEGTEEGGEPREDAKSAEGLGEEGTEEGEEGGKGEAKKEGKGEGEENLRQDAGGTEEAEVKKGRGK